MQKVSDLYKTRRVCQTGRNEPVVLFCSFSSFLRERALFLNEESLPPPTSNFELFRKTRRCKVGWPFVSKKNNARNRPISQKLKLEYSEEFSQLCNTVFFFKQ